MPLKAKILVVDDDMPLRVLLKNFLTQEGFVVDCAVNVVQMTNCLKRSYYDLIVLDWKMPGEDGLSACIRLKATENTPPIFMLTANGSETDCISCLKSGADDFLAKPFNPDVLLARINTLLHRHPRIIANELDADPLFYNFGEYVLDSDRRCLYKNKKKISLTTNEFALLYIMVKHAGKAMSREQLSLFINGRYYMHEDRFIDVQICRLRRLLEKNPNNPTYLQTVRGVGYVLVRDIKTH